MPKPLINPRELTELFKLNGSGVNVADWLVQAEASVDFLNENISSEYITIYASLSHVLIHAALFPKRKLKTLTATTLENGFVQTDLTWRINFAMGGGKPERVFLEEPLDGTFLKGGEKLVFIRSWDGVKKASIELSQKLVHALNLRFIEERNAYCQLDRLGDIEEIIKVIEIPSERFGESVRVITIRAKEFYDFVYLSRMAIAFYFDFTRFQSGSFNGWHDQERFEHHDKNLSYHGGFQPGVGSYIHGCMITQPDVKYRDILRRHNPFDTSDKHYATFKIHDLRSGKLIEASCDPDKVSNYFQSDSKLPLELSPAFFRAEVLHKYKADPTKYELDERHIYCRGTWSLETYDVNEAGQVHTYLRYIRNLPFEEQVYWQSFNEWPKASISKRAFTTDFKGDWDTDYNPLVALKLKIENLNDSKPTWWIHREKDLERRVQYPVTTSAEEWAEAILNLDHLVVEGFDHKELKKIAISLGAEVEEGWRSIKLVEVCLRARGVAADDANESVQSLRKIHELRTIVKGHAAPRKKAEAAKAAIKEHGNFRQHFSALSEACDNSLALIIEALPKT